MPAFSIALGVKAKDKLTGFQGCVTGRCEYLTGCNQYSLLPPAKDDGTFVEPRWFDEQRLEVIDATALRLQNDNPGCDMPAPRAK